MNMNSSFTTTRLLQALFSGAILLSSWDSSCLAFSDYNGAAFYQKRITSTRSSTTPSRQSAAVVVLQQSSSSTTVTSSSSSFPSSWPKPNPKWPEQRTTTTIRSNGMSSNQNVHRLNAFTSSGSSSNSNSRSSSNADNNNDSTTSTTTPQLRGLEALKQIEADLKKQLEDIQFEKRFVLKSRPLNIGVVGFGRFGRFISATFTKYGRVVVTSRSDYSDIATGMGVKYVRLTNPQEFLSHDLDVIIFATSILSFESTIKSFVPHLEKDLASRRRRRGGGGGGVNGDDDDQKVTGPLIVDVLSVKEHPRQILLQYLPKECDILCTHPMFGPDSGKNGWDKLNFVYEKTRINGEVLDQENNDKVKIANDNDTSDATNRGEEMTHVEGMDRVERFLSIWEEEGCNMIDMTCRVHDEYASNSQFITHLMGRILGSQGLSPTPIDTSGFKSVLRLIDSTTADSFDLFYGLYKFNTNSRDTISQLKSALDEVVNDLTYKEKEEQKYLERKQAEKQEEEEQTMKTPQAVITTLASSSPPEGEEFTHTNTNSQ